MPLKRRTTCTRATMSRRGTTSISTSLPESFFLFFLGPRLIVFAHMQFLLLMNGDGVLREARATHLKPLGINESSKVWSIRAGALVNNGLPDLSVDEVHDIQFPVRVTVKVIL